MKCLTEHGVELNRKKCRVGVPKLRFIGHVFSGEGISVDEGKMEASETS